jgi:hypothetical protein
VIEECIEIAGGDHTADPFGDHNPTNALSTSFMM